MLAYAGRFVGSDRIVRVSCTVYTQCFCVVTNKLNDKSMRCLAKSSDEAMVVIIQFGEQTFGNDTE